MTGIALGLAILVSSSGAAPAPETSRARIISAPITFDLRESAGASHDLQHRVLFEQPRPVWQDSSRYAAPRTAAKQRDTATAKIIGASVGAIGGFLAGGAIGWAVTPKRSGYDDVSGLKGVVIGAPIGAVLGAVLGYKLMK